MYPRQRVGAVRIQLRGTQHLPEELEGSTFTAPEDLAYVGRNPTGKRKAMDLLLQLITVSLQALAVGVGILFWIFAVLYGISLGVTRFKRQLDWRRFKKEFGLDHWGYYMDYLLSYKLYGELYVTPRPRDGISKVNAVLGQAADQLQEAFDRENALQRILAAQTELKAAKKKTRLAKRRFWFLHDLASRVVNYPDCDKCSYERHLSMRNDARNRAS